MGNWKNNIQSILIIIIAWLFALAILYIVISKIKLFPR